MPDTLTRLTLVFPPALESQLLEMLLEHQPLLPGFTVLAGEGHGADFARASVREQVRGRVARLMLTLVLSDALADDLLDALRRALPNPEICWWLEPVSAFGRFP